MKRSIILLLATFFLSLNISAQVLDKFAATVNLTKPDVISVGQLEKRIQQILVLRAQTGLPEAQVTRQDKLNILNTMIAEKLIEQGIEKAGITISEQEVNTVMENQRLALEQQNGRRISMEQFKDALISQTQITWEEYLEQVRKQILQQKYISQERGEFIQKNLTAPTDEEIENFYADNRSEFTNPDILRYRQIFFSTINKNASEKAAVLQEAEEVLQKYQNGDKSFDDLVKEFSDDARAAMTGGDAGFLARNDSTARAYLGDSFVREIFNVPMGEVHGVMTSNIGYHIVRVTEKREARILNLFDPIAPNTQTTVRNYIASQLAQQKQQLVLNQAIEDLVEELRKDAEITILTENIE